MNRYLSALFLLFVVTLAPKLFGQSTSNLPQITVAYYDCDCSAAVTSSHDELVTLTTSSWYIYQAIINDTLSSNISITSYGYADSLTAGSSFAGMSFTLPDSGQFGNANYIITSKITGSSGSYVLTISILDGYSYVYAVDKTSRFSSATGGDVKTAALAAVNQLLPLSKTILTYQESVRGANPSLCINPQITVSPAQLWIPLGGSVQVTFTLKDCDGASLSNMKLSLDAKHGTFGSNQVTTNTNGQAQATYTSDGTDAVDLLTATMVNAVTVMHDTISPAGAALITVGDPDTNHLMLLTMSFLYSKTTCKDVLDGDSWEQATSYGAYYAQGFMLGQFYGDTWTTFGAGADRGFLPVGAFYHSLDLVRGSGPNDCCGSSWDITETSYTLLVPQKSGDNGFGDDVHSLTLYYQYPYNEPIDGSIEIGFPPDSIDMYSQSHSFNYTTWDNNNNCSCHTETDSYTDDHIPMMDPGYCHWSIGDPGYTFTPRFQGGDSTKFVGFTATVNYAAISGRKDSSYEVDIIKLNVNAQSTHIPTAINETAKPKEFSLSQNYPNPFNPSTMIEYQLPMMARVTLKVYDVLGREVRTLVDNRQNPGIHKVVFNGSGLPSGVYFYRIQAGTYTATKKLLLLK